MPAKQHQHPKKQQNSRLTPGVLLFYPARFATGAFTSLNRDRFPKAFINEFGDAGRRRFARPGNVQHSHAVAPEKMAERGKRVLREKMQTWAPILLREFDRPLRARGQCR